MRPTLEQKQALVKAYSKAIMDADIVDGQSLTDIYEIAPVSVHKRFEPGTVYHVLILERCVESSGRPVSVNKRWINKLRRILYKKG